MNEWLYPRFMIKEPKFGDSEIIIVDRKDGSQICEFEFKHQKLAEIACAEFNKIESLRIINL